MTDDDEEERKDEQIIKKTLSGLAKSLVNMIKLWLFARMLLFKSFFLWRSLQGNMAKVFMAIHTIAIPAKALGSVTNLFIRYKKFLGL